MENDITKSGIKKRLNRIEGQIRGIQRMIDNDEGCESILVQIAAVRSAISKVGGIILENYANSCISNTVRDDSNDKKISELIDTIVKFTRYYDS